MRLFLRIFELIVALFALGIFSSNYPYVFIGTLGSEFNDENLHATVTSKVRESSYYGRYKEHYKIEFRVPPADNSPLSEDICRGEAIIRITDFMSLHVGDTISVKKWGEYCLSPEDARFEFNGQCFIWLHLIVGVLLSIHLLIRAYFYLNKWEVHDEPKFVQLD